MFFTPELLSRRDSGFGLLWLAATLGAKSSFKKLPKRSVLIADISQLCGLIAEPVEPLALRLSSNLMVGVARVYKSNICKSDLEYVKQEILLTDVTVCFNTLKKVVSEMHVMTSAGELQMGQSSVRPDTVTVATDPTVAFVMDFEHLFQGWDDRNMDIDGRDVSDSSVTPFSIASTENDEDGSDGDFDPTKRSSKKRTRAKATSISVAEQPRADLHTLKENHDSMFSASFDRPLDVAAGGLIPSSSQFGGAGFDDLLDISEDISAELARELGEGWGGAPAIEEDPFYMPRGDADIEMGDVGIHDPVFDIGASRANSVPFPTGDSAIKPPSTQNDDHFLREGSIIVPLSPLPSLQDPDAKDFDEGSRPKQSRKAKHVRLLLDSRTELTNDELERARTHYMESQALLRREIAKKRADRDCGRIIEEMIWGAPRGVNAPALIDFWMENFRLQVEARSGRLHDVNYGQPPKKRRRVDEVGTAADIEDEAEYPRSLEAGIDMEFGGDIGMDFGGGRDVNVNLDYVGGGDPFDIEVESRMRSSEEPGQARRASRPPSLPGSNMDFAPPDFTNISSQRSQLFPWHNAGVSSSISGMGFALAGSDRRSFGRAGNRRRTGSSNKESPLPAGPGSSPASLGLNQYGTDPDFDFELPGDERANESQRSDASVLTLERNSLDFLEYAKMQLQVAPSATLKFDDIVPNETSTRHVAAAAFYHCLGLATKDLLGVEQEDPYGDITITVK